MSDERMNNDLIDEIVSGLRQVPVFGPLDTEDRDAAVDLIAHLRERAEKAEAEIERLREIVDRLPKTADGVPVTPGMNLYAPNVDYDFGALAIVSDSDRPQIECRDVRGVEFGMCASLCYSTREAAEAEKENEDE